PEALEFGAEIELVDLAVIEQAARAVAAVIGIARGAVAEREQRDAASFGDGVFPPAGSAPVDQLLELRTRNDPLIRGPPGRVMRRRDRRGVGRLGAANLDDDGAAHESIEA